MSRASPAGEPSTRAWISIRTAFLTLVLSPATVSLANGPMLEKHFSLWEPGAGRIAVRSDRVSIVRQDNTGAGFELTPDGWMDSQTPSPYKESRHPTCDVANRTDDRTQQDVIAALPAAARIKSTNRLSNGRVLVVYSNSTAKQPPYEVFTALLIRTKSGALTLATTLLTGDGQYCETHLLENDLLLVVLWEDGPEDDGGYTATGFTIRN